MERIAFLVESTGVRLGCLLNPETLVVRRTAGVTQRHSQGRPVTGARLRDDPLLYTGGGTTELTLDLLFDVNLSGSSITTQDVRDLTRPLWELAENVPQDDGYGRPPLVRFVWGKSWNIPGVVTAVAERLEFFSPEGAPRRSWLRMRMIRVDDSAARRPAAGLAPAGAAPGARASTLPPDAQIPPERVHLRELTSAGPEQGDGKAPPRLDEVAHQEYGDPSLWRLIAEFNDMDDPMKPPEGKVLAVPDLSVLEEIK
jgi:hypothetical protein